MVKSTESVINRNDPKMLSDLLMRGAKIMAKLLHPNIARIYTEIQYPLGIVMEWIEGYSLREIIDKELPMSITKVARIGFKLADALEYAHQKRIIHRDIKPENIILKKENDEPVLIDFDIARSETVGTITTEQSCYIGTEPYMSPEQYNTPALVKPETDLFSLGLVLYELLTRNRPFKSSCDLDTYLNKCLPIPKQLNIEESMYQILCKLLRQSPQDRLTAFGLKQELEKLMESHQL